MFAPDLVVVLVLLETMIFLVPSCSVFRLATEVFACLNFSCFASISVCISTVNLHLYCHASMHLHSPLYWRPVLLKQMHRLQLHLFEKKKSCSHYVCQFNAQSPIFLYVWISLNHKVDFFQWCFWLGQCMGWYSDYFFVDGTACCSVIAIFWLCLFFKQ